MLAEHVKHISNNNSLLNLNSIFNKHTSIDTINRLAIYKPLLDHPYYIHALFGRIRTIPIF